jgi:hypothetical protein
LAPWPLPPPRNIFGFFLVLYQWFCHHHSKFSSVVENYFKWSILGIIFIENNIFQMKQFFVSFFCLHDNRHD